jgi:hypothetical protein
MTYKNTIQIEKSFALSMYTVYAQIYASDSEDHRSPLQILC